MGDTQKAQFSPLTGTAALLASKFLSCEQVAAILHVHVGTLRRWRHLAQGPPFARVGRQVVYLQRIEELCAVPIDIISTGPDREETIVMRHPFDPS